MRAANRPKAQSTNQKLLVIDPKRQSLRDATFSELPSLLSPADLVVVNDAATLPASLFAVGRGGALFEVRLVSRQTSGTPGEGEHWRAVLLGAGDWRTPTERRPPPVLIEPGERISFGPDSSATVTRLFPISPRFLELAFHTTGDAFWRALYARGRPIQYAYLAREIALAEVQTSYASRPWAVEMPSAGRPLSWSILFAMMERGIRVRSLTHAAGISSSGEKAIDAEIPFDEVFDIPIATAAAIEETRANRGQVIAVGTTVVRALESSALGSEHVRPGHGRTDLKIDGRFKPSIVGGVLTGVHERTASHSALLEAFAPRALLDAAAAHSDARGYLGHEFGDSWLIA